VKTFGVGILLLLAAGLAAFAVACGGDDAETLTLGDLTVEDHGTRDVSNLSTVEIEADNNYFEPTFLKGRAGQNVRLTVTNSSTALHNISVPSLAIDSDVQANGRAEIEFTLPQSGVLLFICKYHSAQGMNGEFLVGDAQPQAASAVPVTPIVKVVNHATLGPILADNAGKTLYKFTNDVPNSGRSAATGNTAVVWPPLTLAAGDPIKPQGVSGTFGIIMRDDGGRQVTYNGLPLYYYSRDANVGDTSGQGVGNVWFVVNP
jgi:predicted lipoprotein with Yx(FWY)xxD motif